MQRSKRTNQTTHRSEWRSLLKKDLTGPTLLEMSGNPTYRDLNRQLNGTSKKVRWVAPYLLTEGS